MPELSTTHSFATKKPGRVKIFGERNTGTNALAKLIRRNSASDVLPTRVGELPGLTPLVGRVLSRLTMNSCRESLTDWVFARAEAANKWKHRATYFSDSELDQLAEIPTLIIIRHPASWLVGLHRKPYHALQTVPKDLSAFLQQEWKTAGREGLKRKCYLPPALYNEKLRAYFWFEQEMLHRGGAVMFIRFEDFVADQVAVFNMVSPILKDPDPAPRIIASSTKKSGKSADDYARYYRDQVWAESIGSKAQDIIQSDIDWSLACRFYDDSDWRAARRA